MGADSILQKYGIDLRGQKKRSNGKRFWSPEMRQKIAQLGREHGAIPVADDLGINVTQLRRWMKVEPIPGMGAAEDGAVNGHEGGDVNGIPLKNKPGRKRKNTNGIQFQTSDIESALVLLGRLQGQRGRVSITIE